jgi:hypothetical protein
MSDELKTTEKDLGIDCGVRVAVFWPGEGYGIATEYLTFKRAQEAARKLISQGYGKSDRSAVHIIQWSRHVIEYTEEAPDA